MQLRLELPYRLPDSKPFYIDIVATLGAETFAIELKYITAGLNYTHNNEEFMLKNHSAQDLRRYDILKDVSRIEVLLNSGHITGGISVNLTNDSALWTGYGLGRNDEAFRLPDGRKISGDLAWTDLASKGTIKGRELPLFISQEYEIQWKNYSVIDTPNRNQFKLLILGPKVSSD